MKKEKNMPHKCILWEEFLSQMPTINNHSIKLILSLYMDGLQLSQEFPPQTIVVDGLRRRASFFRVVASMDYDSSASSFPLRHKKLTLHIKENKTDIVISSHDDQIMVIATQIGTMGTIMHARKEEGMLNSPTFNVSVIFGKRDEPMLLACARQLIEHISNSGSSKPLTLSLGLKDHSVETLKGIVSAVIENRLW